MADFCGAVEQSIDAGVKYTDARAQFIAGWDQGAEQNGRPELVGLGGEVFDRLVPICLNQLRSTTA